MNGRTWSGSPSIVQYLHILFSLNEKSPCFPIWGNKDRNTNSAVPPCLPKNSATSARCQHTGCPLTLAMRQKILWANPFPPALGGPFAAPLFALLSALQNSLWMRLAALLPLRRFLYDGLVILQICPFVKHKNSPLAEIRRDRGTAFFSGKNSRKAGMQPSDTSWPVPSGRCPGNPISGSGQIRRGSLPAAR